MKLRIKKEERNFLLTQLYLFLMTTVIILMVTAVAWKDMKAALGIFFIVSLILLRLWVVFALNNYLLVPKLYRAEKHRKAKIWGFWAGNLVLIFLLNYHFFFSIPNAHDVKWQHAINFGYTIGGFVWLVVNYAMVGLSIGRQSYLRQQQLKRQLAEEKEKSTEAELAWLKNQLNPHFLFNTLNNISSLIQIDSDKAQDKIGQLSDLLRYALYETKTEMVDIGKEMEFMQNYIDLMSLRCGANVDIKVNFDIHDTRRKIAPMLFLSPIENAFKHGVSASKPSFIHISMNDQDGNLVFECRNSNYPKDDTNRSGSGIGIENLRRRLQLIYPRQHTFEQRLDNDTYIVKIAIKSL